MQCSWRTVSKKAWNKTKIEMLGGKIGFEDYIREKNVFFLYPMRIGKILKGFEQRSSLILFAY